MSLMVTVEDALNVAMKYSNTTRDLLYSEMVKKCWITNGPEKGLKDAIRDINPRAIACEIAKDNLSTWCNEICVDIQCCVKAIVDNLNNDDPEEDDRK